MSSVLKKADKLNLSLSLSPLAKEIVVGSIPLAKENFLIMSPILHDFKEVWTKHSLFKRNFPKADVNLAQKYIFFMDFRQKYTLG